MNSIPQNPTLSPAEKDRHYNPEPFKMRPKGLVVAVWRMTPVGAHGKAFTALDFGALGLARHYRIAGGLGISAFAKAAEVYIEPGAPHEPYALTPIGLKQE